MTDPDLHVLTIGTDDGVRLAATRLGRPAATATLVYVHALGHERRFWIPLAGRVHQQLSGAIAQIVYDQRGHGDSAKPAPRQITTLRRLADDLDTVLAHASGSVVLVAHSTAAPLVYAYAIRHREPAGALAGLVLLNATAEPLALPRYLRTWPKRLVWFRRHRSLDAVTAAGEAMLAHRLRRTGHPFAANSGADARVTLDVLGTHPGFGLHVKAAEALRPIPTVVLAGEHDTVVPPHRAVTLADALRADYDIVAGAGHHLPRTHLERATDTITTIVDHALRLHLEDPAHTPDSERGRA
ncbi:pimeloyl-ACP methyl ester carboxylesterase [Nocardia kruczakiae]|uniref:Pimeloyl-ACP methyl ester carboxylesterase n=1 Tax=Nocardia kruczakiae TaxID=261477 RepID=A0ABU1XQN8_9NOCA|nr:alpha/beta fold hydrolase [Nocardia kruczakiae]MDR7172878.1 pimeloyl-ACP methyl ester carboxylesterase [Nocardia kruczakiae]